MNNTNIFIFSILISLLFFFVIIIENKLLNTHETGLKVVFKDSLIVFITSVIGLNLIEQIYPLIYENSGLTNPPVFTDVPGF